MTLKFRPLSSNSKDKGIKTKLKPLKHLLLKKLTFFSLCMMYFLYSSSKESSFKAQQKK